MHALSVERHDRTALVLARQPWSVVGGRSNWRTLGADLAGPRLASLMYGYPGDPKSGDRVKPPPAERSIGEDADQRGSGDDRAQPRLRRVRCGRPRAELGGDAALARARRGITTIAPADTTAPGQLALG